MLDDELVEEPLDVFEVETELVVVWELVVVLVLAV